MKLQTKVLVLLSLVTVVILLFFVSYQFIRFRENNLLYKENLKSQEMVIDKVLQLNRIRFEQLINDNSGWDEMVEFAQNPDTSWADENVDFFVNSFQLSFVLVYNKGKNLVYRFGHEKYLREINFIDSQLIDNLFLKNAFPHFFVVINGELVEFFGATIVPAADADMRKTEPQGYIFTAKNWDSAIINELGLATNYNTGLMVNSPVKPDEHSETQSISRRELKDYNANTVANLIFYGNDMVKKEKNLLLLLSFLVMFFAVASVLVLMYYFRNIVIQPLRQISESLGKKNPDYLKAGGNSTHEFKQIKELITGYFQQETELKANYAALKELNAQKSKLFSVVAVNLKNPVEGLISLSELLEDSLKRLDNENTKELLDMIGNQANQTLHLLETLFDWSRLQSDKMNYNPEGTNLKMVIDQVLHDLKLSYTLKNISIEVHLAGQFLVNADYKMLKIILRNLISNAVKFTYSGGWVKVSVQQAGNFVQINVSDNGVGISPENLKSLFNIDANQPGIGTDNERGTGLGLVISKVFVEKHGGAITVVSKEEQGSVFTFTIPLV